MNEDNGGNGVMTGFFVGTLLGAAVGAGAALLLAPRTGKETRERLSGSAERQSQSGSGLSERSLFLSHFDVDISGRIGACRPASSSPSSVRPRVASPGATPRDSRRRSPSTRSSPSRRSS